MKRWDREAAIARMNRLSATDEAFLFVVDFEEKKCIVEPLSEIPTDECQLVLGAYTRVSNELSPLPTSFRWRHEAMAYDDYEKRFEKVVAHLKRGDSFLTNLTCRLPLESDLSLYDLFAHAQAPYRFWLKDECTCFSPEPFVRIHDGVISSYPMKGTIDATLPHAAELLMNNRKEAAEHATIIDLIRNDLSRVANRVEVARYRYIEEIVSRKGRILQSSSEIRGRVDAPTRGRWGDVLFQLLPAGSISGAPKCRTVEIIREAEGEERGYYTGVMGCYERGNVESAVMIRFVEQDAAGRRYYRAGGGITAMSDCESEYEEINQKVYAPIR